ncbi:MAG TPA: pitrilysin family protein [Thermoanaerobaculia bacterium]|nr:pitrilysin family protein [Thermoanaerobaculia bacterium]
MKLIRNFAVAAASLVMITGSAFGQATSVNDIKSPPLRSFSMPQPKRIQLPNGMVIFLMEDHELPLVRGSALIRGGSRNVPNAKAGLLGIYTGSWRTGGTTTKTGDELDQLLESKAAFVETGGSTASTTVSMNVLKNDFDTVFPIWVDVLRNPAFREDKITLAKTQANTGISRRNDEPGGILGRESTKLGYGADSPYAQQAEYASISSITRDDLVAFHKQFVHPNNIIVSFIGDFNSATLEKKLRDTFGSWAKGPQAPKAVVDITPAKAGVYFIPKPDVTQANIAYVHPGIMRDNPDYYALQVMNEVFSGGFSGRLMQSLRSQKGLTYGVGGAVGANWDYPGLFRAQMATKSGTAIESVNALREEIVKLTRDPVTAAELSLSKESILNAFVFTMDTRAKALDQQVQLEFYGFPADYYTKYPSNIEKVTAADVERVAKKYVQPDQLALLVVGNEKDFEKPLSSLGNVTTIDIAIPEPGSSGGAKPAASAAPATGNAEGLVLANKVADFVGGKAKVDAVTATRRSSTVKVNTPNGEMEMETTQLVRYPDSVKAVMNTPMGAITRVITPDAAFMIMPNGPQDIPSSQRASAANEMKSDLLTVLRNIGNPKYTFTSGVTETVNGVSTRVLEINADGQTVKWYVDPATGKLLRTISRASGPVPGDAVTDITEWKSFGGLNLPAAASTTINGEKAMSLTVSNVEVNPAIAADEFKKPEAK